MKKHDTPGKHPCQSSGIIVFCISLRRCDQIIISFYLIMASIALVDDHVLLRHGLAVLIRELGHTILYEADNGKHCIELLDMDKLPDMVLLDINMPVMDGYETAAYLKGNFPAIKVIALSMHDEENSIIRMLKNGARGYILKDCEPFQFSDALRTVMDKGYYHSELVSSKLIHAINHYDEVNGTTREILNFNEKEILFLKLCCTELTYKEIAAKMIMSPRTIDTYRDKLFEKLRIKSRVGLAVYAIRMGIVTV